MSQPRELHGVTKANSADRFSDLHLGEMWPKSRRRDRKEEDGGRMKEGSQGGEMEEKGRKKCRCQESMEAHSAPSGISVSASVRPFQIHYGARDQVHTFRHGFMSSIERVRRKIWTRGHSKDAMEYISMPPRAALANWCLLWRSRRSECTDIWSGFLARPRLFSEIFF